ncbi:MAG: hypothetical protein HWE16_05505, partial [Gammaproteobacteria bacterium]|nr:hypothetical protein [Gammaproteobacteria bacterium]
HMNGRAYDYNLGRFLSVDPFIQFVGNSQSLNPYSYILNNPLAATDPSGYLVCVGQWNNPACQNPDTMEPSQRPIVDPVTQYHRQFALQVGAGGNGGDGKTNQSNSQDEFNFKPFNMQPEGTVGKGNIKIGSSRHKVLQQVADSPILSIFMGNTIELLINAEADLNGGEKVPPGSITLEATSNFLGTTLSAGMLPSSTEALIPDSSGALSPVAPELVVAGPAINTTKNLMAAREPLVANPVPASFTRVVPGNVNPTMLGRGADDVFVTDSAALRGLNSKEIAHKLTIPESSSGFRLIEFSSKDITGIASPVYRNNPGFVGKGKTAGGAPEYVIPNRPIPKDANIRVVK